MDACATLREKQEKIFATNVLIFTNCFVFIRVAKKQNPKRMVSHLAIYAI